MSCELLTSAEMGEADRLTIAGGTAGRADGGAGRAVADRAAAILRKRGGTRIAVLCGPGNNGGDGCVAAHARDGVPTSRPRAWRSGQTGR